MSARLLRFPLQIIRTVGTVLVGTYEKTRWYQKLSYISLPRSQWGLEI